MTANAEQALQRTRGLVEAARLISAGGLDLDAILDALTEQASRLLAANAASLHLANQDGSFVVRRANPLAEADSIFSRVGTRYRPGPYTSDAIGSRHPISTDNYPADDRIRVATKLQFPAVMSTLVVPLVAGDDLVGVLHLNWTEPHEVTPEDLEVAEALGAHAAVAIRTARLLERRREGAIRTAWAQAVTAALSHALTPEEVTAVVVREGTEAMRARAGLVALLTPDRGEIEIVMSAGYPEEAVVPWRRFPVDAPVPLSDTVRTGQPIFIETAAEVIERYPALADTQAITQMGALAALPLAVTGQTIGAFGMSFRDNRAFEPDERDWMVTLAQRCSMALDRARLYEQVRRSDEGYRLVAEAASAAIWERDLTSDVVSWNGGLGVFGYQPDEVENTTAWWAMRLHPDDRDRVRSSGAAALRRCGAGKTDGARNFGSTVRTAPTHPVFR
jgi:GAF domain-containing protein